MAKPIERLRNTHPFGLSCVMTQAENSKKTWSGAGWMCRRCLSEGAETPGSARCASCGRPGLTSHTELFDLSIAHIDCDAFYASVEKRDNPELAAKPVIIGGGTRGVVATCCYVARTKGVRSAMPMFKALEACPEAIVIKPNMAKYAAVGSAIREAMEDLTPVVQPLSIDEAFLDLTGTQALHGKPPALVLRDFQQTVAERFGVTVSVGLSYNKLMAKIASDLQKPRGFSVLGTQDGPTFLAQQDLSILWGIGKVTLAKMNGQGLYKVGDLLAYSEEELFARFGAWGQRLYRYARGQDSRSVVERAKSQSVSNETTFNTDLAKFDDFSAPLWGLCEKLAERLKDKERGAYTITLKLKDRDFKSISRSQTLANPTASADKLYEVACALLMPEIGPRKAYRLIGVGTSSFADIALADPMDLADPDAYKRQQLESAMDQVKAKLGKDTPILRGRGLK